ncbi:hypothetical protein K2173_003660 [Erythroxylum novogranatense]|uniref:Uncharacterized protein n=1 Tax=Erythroxylum novogranatense TaxID=1862640 RepID=A0AAV8TCN9_9ROSI|nr:hypothetical protein K2173_003660 [Erythroxylum novogranatense]
MKMVTKHVDYWMDLYYELALQFSASMVLLPEKALCKDRMWQIRKIREFHVGCVMKSFGVYPFFVLGLTPSMVTYAGFEL